MFVKFAVFIVLISFGFASSSQCGVPAKGLSLIINGQNFVRGAWPWMVALLQKSSDDNKFFCGGVLIGKNKVLTAAHCIQEKYQRPRKTRDIVLLLGAYDLDDRNEEGVFLTTPSEVIMHPDWNPSSMRYDADIAVILLEDEVPFTKFIKPICIGSANIEINEGTVTGWGKSEDVSKAHENIPKEVKAPIYTNEHCLLEAVEFAQLASKRTLCAGGRNNSGPCNGDSGGGLFVRGSDGVYHLKGIVSAALVKQGNCDVSNFALYTNVDKFIEWIDAPTVVITATESCGIMSSSSGLIQNGKIASSVQWPWAVIVFNKHYEVTLDEEKYSSFQVGSLVSARHVIADGMLLSKEENGIRSPFSTDKIKLYFGVTNIDDFANSNSLVIDGAEKISLHPDLGNIHSLKFANFAIIQVKAVVPFSRYISPVCISSFNGDAYDFTGRFAYAVGMGYSETGLTKDRRYTPVRIRNKEICDSEYDYSLGTAKNRSLYFCAGGDMKSIGCWSDHPLYLKQGGKWFLHAFHQVSYNKDKGCSTDLSTLYELAGPYYHWIQNIINRF